MYRKINFITCQLQHSILERKKKDFCRGFRCHYKGVSYVIKFLYRSGAIQEVGQVEELRPLAKEMTDGSSDAFFTNRLFPWRLIPEVVPGRMGVAMWLVAASLALEVTVIDVTPTVFAVHMTTEAGNYESHSHPNANCNHELFRSVSRDKPSIARHLFQH